MKKQTIIGIIIGIIIFSICLCIYIVFRNEWLLDEYNFDKEEYEEYYDMFSNRNIKKVSYDYDNINENKENLNIHGSLNIELKDVQINKNQIKLNLENHFEEGFGKVNGGTIKETVKFSYYIHDNNKNLIANYIHTRRESRPIIQYFYKENKDDINMSYEKYFWHVNDNNNLVNTSFNEKIYDEENSKINFIIDKRNDKGFQDFSSLTLVLYDYSYDMYSQYDPSDESKLEVFKSENPSYFYEIEINNINF
ncbi:MAG: hypothetical protein IKL55_05415 [Clostridia bacterium]|nr:hypothetical protein [Clostridia bacterium]